MGGIGSAFEDFSICWAGRADCSVDWDAITGLGTVGALLLSAWLAWKAHREAADNKAALESVSRAFIGQYLFRWMDDVERLQNFFYETKNSEYFALASVMHRPSQDLVDRASTLSPEEARMVAAFVAHDERLKVFSDLKFRIAHIVDPPGDLITKHLGTALRARNEVEPMCTAWWSKLHATAPSWVDIRRRLDNKLVDPSGFGEV